MHNQDVVMKASYRVEKLGPHLLIPSFLSSWLIFFFKELEDKRAGNEPDALSISVMDILS